MSPDFIVIGAPKAGTTSLWRILSQHPEVSPCKMKEPGFFMRDEVYQKGWDWYTSLYDCSRNGRIYGEATTEYSQTRSFPHTVERIAKHAPDAKLIFMIRHPFETLVSRWRQSLSNRDPVPRTFARAIFEYPPLLENVRYAQTIEDFLTAFTRQQLLLVVFEDFKTNPEVEARRVFEFLGISTVAPVFNANAVSNSGREKDIDTGLVSFLRALPGASLLRSSIPKSIRVKCRTFTRRSPLEAEWTPQLVEKVRDEIEDDARLVLVMAGKPETFWDFSGPPIKRY